MARRLIRRLGGLTALALFGVGVLGVIFVVGMRRKWPGMQRAVRRMNKACWNPKVMQTAGTPGASASVVHHVGRRSGTAYETPVASATTDDGFVIGLPYGTRADWVRNVLAAGRATITCEGETYEVGHPEVVPIERVDAYFGASDRRAQRTFGIEECLRLRRVDATTGEPTGREAGEPSRSAS